MLRSVGLGGDGDEVEAIRRVERAFGVTFAVADCERFETVGDIWEALSRLQPGGDGARWAMLAAAVSEETGADPARVGPGTRLLAEPLRTMIGRAIGRWFGRA